MNDIVCMIVGVHSFEEIISLLEAVVGRLRGMSSDVGVCTIVPRRIDADKLNHKYVP